MAGVAAGEVFPGHLVVGLQGHLPDCLQSHLQGHLLARLGRVINVFGYCRAGQQDGRGRGWKVAKLSMESSGGGVGQLMRELTIQRLNHLAEVSAR